ncbi:hypothetical protein [Streptomyces odontomachi]|uniref:hypothetical protein n=1 Tax=Streptomyces odontomachi TaxID=2944940 RepID=UPI002108D368|nr:hypothetical protein [Streptomyces sp. ODS25]
MSADTPFRSALRTWVREKTGDAVFDDDSPLFEQRFLRSVHVPELLVFMERLRRSPIDVERLRIDDFRSINTLVARFDR